MFKKAIYWIRYTVSFPFLWLGFGLQDLGLKISKTGIHLQDLAVAIEGPLLPDDPFNLDYHGPACGCDKCLGKVS